MNNIDMERVLQTGISLSTEKDRNKLLDLIITEAMEISHADGGTLYIYSEEENCLYFKIMRNHTLKVYQGDEGEEVGLPAVPMTMENVCTCAAILRKSINIPDVYHSDQFDFSGPKKYDNITGYHTQSMLVLPLENTRGEIVGVLQLINAKDHEGNVEPFSEDLNMVITSLASQAAIAITNSMYLDDIKSLFHSFVQVMITAIDEMSPYNVNHTRKIAAHAERFIDYLNDTHSRRKYPEFFDDARKEQFLMATWMHDIGKLITPPEVMNKATRLASEVGRVLAQFDLAAAMKKIAFLEGKMSKEEYEAAETELAADRAFVENANHTEFMDDQKIAKLEALYPKRFLGFSGEEEAFLTPQNYECLSVRRGTLTQKEREVMQGHAKLTEKLLRNIKFGKDLRDVPRIASMHHECLDGSGYPNGVVGEEIPSEVRILSILDIYEALTSSDRPYKKPMDPSAALLVLKKMAEEGKLDRELVELFAQSLKDVKGN